MKRVAKWSTTYYSLHTTLYLLTTYLGEARGEVVPDLAVVVAQLLLGDPHLLALP